ncbi:hypothetical protein A6P53_07020 [Enterococcus hirae]|nr:hypothetical protein A6P53_07020 [Enterococcus hirae]
MNIANRIHPLFHDETLPFHCSITYLSHRFTFIEKVFPFPILIFSIKRKKDKPKIKIAKEFPYSLSAQLVLGDWRTASPAMFIFQLVTKC